MKLLYDSSVAVSYPNRWVKIFEKSALAKEAGAALHLSPNANGLLRRLGIHADKHGANLLLGVKVSLLNTDHAKEGRWLNMDPMVLSISI
jgi:hypothetical protein